jgi:hypothetical protein|tara:strand:+ start:83 stop:475 length:393 start_codon:yes stop_codon:yes gene_type:complete
MNFYTIHLRHKGLDLDRDVAVIKEGFSWTAFFFSILWACSHRLWSAVGVYLFIQGAIYLIFQKIQLDLLSQGIVFLGINLIFGFLANDLIQLKLSREGFELFGIMKRKNKDIAYGSFLENSSIIFKELDR